MTQTVSRQDARALARSYAMKAVEDTNAPDVIVGNFIIFDTIVHALIDLRSTHSYVCTDIPNLGNLPRSETEYDILVTNPIATPEPSPTRSTSPNRNPGTLGLFLFIFRVIKFSL